MMSATITIPQMYTDDAGDSRLSTVSSVLVAGMIYDSSDAAQTSDGVSATAFLVDAAEVSVRRRR
jgi:hypothetical protein